MTSDDPESVLDTNLDALAKRKRTQSTAALIRHFLPKIEAAQKAGASNAEILESFREAGFDIPLSTFQSTLSRVRKSRGANITPTTGKQMRAAQPPTGKRRGLQMPEPPKGFDWDPLERPKIEFNDDEDKE